MELNRNFTLTILVLITHALILVVGGHGIGNLIMLEAIIFLGSFGEIWNSSWIWVIVASFIGQILILFTMIKQRVRYIRLIGLALLVISVAVTIVMVSSYHTQEITVISSLPFFTCAGILIYKIFLIKRID